MKSFVIHHTSSMFWSFFLFLFPSLHFVTIMVYLLYIPRSHRISCLRRLPSDFFLASGPYNFLSCVRYSPIHPATPCILTHLCCGYLDPAVFISQSVVITSLTVEGSFHDCRGRNEGYLFLQTTAGNTFQASRLVALVYSLSPFGGNSCTIRFTDSKHGCHQEIIFMLWAKCRASDFPTLHYKTFFSLILMYQYVSWHSLQDSVAFQFDHMLTSISATTE